MKKHALIFTLASIISVSTFAQLAIGVRTGANFSTYKGEDIEDNKNAFGYNVVVPIEKMMGESFSIQSEFHWIQKGVKFEGAGDDYSKTMNNYLEFALAPKIKFGPDWLKGYVLAGPTIGYALNGTQTIEIDGEKTSEDIEFTSEGAYQDNRLDFGVGFGFGAELLLGPGALVFDARYNLDLNDNVKIDGDKPDGYNKTTNSGIALTLGYMIHFGGNN